MDFAHDRYINAEKIISQLSTSIDLFKHTADSIKPNQKESIQANDNESLFAFNPAAGFNSYGAITTRVVDIYDIAKASKDYRHGFRIERYLTKSVEIKYRVKNPAAVGFGSTNGKNKVYSKTYIDSQLARGNTPKIAGYLNPGTGIKTALKTKVGWIGAGVTTAENITKNITSGATVGRTVGDAAVDVGLGAAVIATGALVSTFAVGVVGAPVLVGAVVAAGSSIGASYILDGISIGKGKDKKSLSNHIKDGVQTMAGWFKGDKKGK